MTVCRLLATTAASFLVGCAEFHAYCDEQLVASRNSYIARTAWNERGGALCEGRQHHKHFKKGFCEGYNNVACGMGGVAPLVPPEEYWAAGYQDADGREIVNEWFAGYNEGAFAAAQDGVGVLCEVPTWVGGACCDKNGRIYAKPDPAARKPRRGDPPKRAQLPPASPKIPRPTNTEGKEPPPIVDPLLETPLPSLKKEPAKLPLDGEVPELRKKKEAPPEKEPLQEKKGTARKRTEKKSAPVANTMLEPYAIPVAAERRVQQEPAKPIVREGSPYKVQRPVVKTEGGDRPLRSAGEMPTLPLNPFSKMGLNDGPRYAAPPPVIDAPALKPDLSISTPSGLPAMGNVPTRKEPTPPMLSDGDLPSPPRARTTRMVADKVKGEPAPQPAIAPASHQEAAKPADTWQRQASISAAEAKPRESKPQPERAPLPSPDAPLPVDVEDGWGTPHDYLSPRRAAGK